MMEQKINAERKNIIKNKVLQACKFMPRYTLPVDIEGIIKNYPGIELRKYSDLEKLYGSYDELIKDVKTRDSFVSVVNPGQFLIAYNDINIELKMYNRDRWNLAHELGHVLLSHHTIAQQNKLDRGGISNELYSYLECEADYFAQLILVPHACLCNFKIPNYRAIRNLCKISDAAANRRFNEYQNWYKHMSADNEYDTAIFHLFYEFSFKRKCKKCESIIIQRYGNYCQMCGAKNTLEWSDKEMIKFPKLETYSNGKLKECPICENGETDLDGDYCQICGTSLVNKCTNQRCTNSKPLPSNARFCPECGNASLFYTNKLLQAVEIDIDDFDLDIDDEDEYLPFS